MQTSLQLRSYGYASPYRATGGNPYIQCVRAPQSAFPVEVKSGKDYERHQALNNVLGNDEYADVHS